ncbi:hypothetical protein ACPCXA_11045 [Lysinibacillus agricola]
MFFARKRSGSGTMFFARKRSGSGTMFFARKRSANEAAAATAGCWSRRYKVDIIGYK